jgi:very-short-patch-repair endonuclease
MPNGDYGWWVLHDRRLAGYKFRRQCPIGPYIANFASIRYRVVIEVDGSQHLDNAADQRRSEWLEGRGWCVIRFWNNDVSGNPNRVAEYVLNLLRSRPALTLPSLRAGSLPLPRAGEGL